MSFHNIFGNTKADTQAIRPGLPGSRAAVVSGKDLGDFIRLDPDTLIRQR